MTTTACRLALDSIQSHLMQSVVPRLNSNHMNSQKLAVLPVSQRQTKLWSGQSKTFSMWGSTHSCRKRNVYRLGNRKLCSVHSVKHQLNCTCPTWKESNARCSGGWICFVIGIAAVANAPMKGNNLYCREQCLDCNVRFIPLIAALSSRV